MRLQRVGRRNDPSYRIVVTDKRTGPKSNKNVAILGSYNPKMDHIQLDTDAAKDWLAKGVQPSDTMHNILVGQNVIDGKKVNVLPKKSPIINEEAAKAEAEAKEAAEAGEAEEGGAEESADTPTEEAANEEAPEEVKEEESTEAEKTDETPAKEETKEDAEKPAEEEAK
ncbi:MAG: 30S ribosomal protein S16 [Candidatus Paceibacterota bacterium]